jgi:hypothetical protein
MRHSNYLDLVKYIVPAQANLTDIKFAISS